MFARKLLTASLCEPTNQSRDNLRLLAVSVRSLLDPQQALLRYLWLDEADANQSFTGRPGEGHRPGYGHHLRHRHRRAVGHLQEVHR